MADYVIFLISAKALGFASPEPIDRFVRSSADGNVEEIFIVPANHCGPGLKIA